MTQLEKLPIKETLIAERLQYAELYAIILEASANRFYLGSALACKLKRNKIGGRNHNKQSNDKQSNDNTNDNQSNDLLKLVKSFDELDEFALEFYGGSKSSNDNSNIIDELRTIADKLFNHLVKTNSPHFIVLKTDIPYQKYTILLDDTRLLATYFELSPQFIDTITYGSPTSEKHSREKHYGLQLLPTKAQLVDIYRDLASPQPDLWETQLDKLRDLLKITVGGVDEVPNQQAAADNRIKIIEKFAVNNSDVLLIGDHAMRLKNKQSLRNRVVQLLALNPDMLATNIAQYIGGQIYQTHEAIMRDRRLQRTSIRAHGVDIVHIYHNLTYDVVGFETLEYIKNSSKKHGGDEKKHNNSKIVNIGSQAVLARFILIDYWLLVGKLVSGRVPEVFFQNKKAEILEDFATVSNVTHFVPPENFIGVYISEAAYAKQVRKDVNFPPYLPEVK